MKLTALDAIHIAYSIRDYFKNNPNPINCNKEKLMKLADWLLEIKNLENNYCIDTIKLEKK